jgi:hypothetical protein
MEVGGELQGVVEVGDRRPVVAAAGIGGAADVVGLGIVGVGLDYLDRKSVV